jgi:hypothetical protein
MKFFRTALGLSLVLAAAAAAYGMSVKTDYDKSYDFGRLKTFSFRVQRRSDSDPLKANTLVADRIEGALRAQLEAHGFQYQPEGRPDFVAAFYARKKEKVQIEDLDYGLPFRRRWRWGFGPDIWTRYYTEGSVMVDFIAPQTKQLVWRGVVTDTISGVGQSEKQISQGADELVKHFMKDIGRKK